MPDISAISSEIRSASGFIAIVDALGASVMTFQEAAEFVRLRDTILRTIPKILETSLKLDVRRLRTLTLNDTVVFVYEADVDLAEIERFCHLLRYFEALTVRAGQLFRGAFAIGEFFRGEEASNTVMGPAVSDAAAWYGKAEWIGIHATPHATLLTQSLLAQVPPASLDHVLVDYEVPFKDKTKLLLKAINWPKYLYLLNDRHRDKAWSDVHQRIIKRPIPLGSESKQFHSIAFYKTIQDQQEFGKPRG